MQARDAEAGGRGWWGAGKCLWFGDVLELGVHEAC